MKNSKKGKNIKSLALDPEFQKKIKALLPDDINESISILYEIATRDEKTGLYNNHFFNNILEIEMERAKREDCNLSLIMTDIDFFKQINDKYGHIEADEILYKLARVLDKQIRKSDILARFGGDEFLFLLPRTKITDAQKLTTRFKKAIQKDKALSKYNLTMSGGITKMKKTDSKKTFLKRANKALLKSKSLGRDQFNLE